MQIGIDSFVETALGTGRAAGELGAERVRQLLEEIELADRVGVDVYGIGEHHREEYVASSPAVLLFASGCPAHKAFTSTPSSLTTAPRS